MSDDKLVVTTRKPAVGKSSVILVRLPDAMLGNLKKVAGETSNTRNELVQMCIEL